MKLETKKPELNIKQMRSQAGSQMIFYAIWGLYAALVLGAIIVAGIEEQLAPVLFAEIIVFTAAAVVLHQLVKILIDIRDALANK